jgi:hypothetical protein
LRLHPEELLEQDPVGLDPQKSFTEVDEDGGVEKKAQQRQNRQTNAEETFGSNGEEN